MSKAAAAKTSSKSSIARFDRQHSADKYVDPYEGEGKQYGCDYDNFEVAQIRLPFRMLITGPSSSGKNVVMYNLLRLLNCFDRYLVVAKELDQTTFSDLRERAEKCKAISYEETNDLANLPDVESWDKKQNNMVIVDDMICEDKKKLKLVADYYVRCRHRNVSILFLSQDYFEMPKMMRRNANILIVKNINSRSDLKRILNENGLTAKPDRVLDMYRQAMDHSSTGKPHMHWFCIDKGNPNPNFIFRANFDGIPAECWREQLQ